MPVLDSSEQGSFRRVLFVCSGGILRAPTAAHWAAEHMNWNTRSAGVLPVAVPPLHPNLLDWARRIYCMEQSHADFIETKYPGEYSRKIKILHIPDDFHYRQAALRQLLERALKDE